MEQVQLDEFCGCNNGEWPGATEIPKDKSLWGASTTKWSLEKCWATGRHPGSPPEKILVTEVFMKNEQDTGTRNASLSSIVVKEA